MSRPEILAAIRKCGESGCKTCVGHQHELLTEHGYLRRLAQSAARHGATTERVQKIQDAKTQLSKYYDRATEHLEVHLGQAS